MKVDAKNKLVSAALGVTSIEFKFYRDGNAHWRVTIDDGQELSIVTHNFGTESTVLRLTAAELAKRGSPVRYPKGA